MEEVPLLAGGRRPTAESVHQLPAGHPVGGYPVNNQRVFTANVGVSAAYADGDGTPGYIFLGVWNTSNQQVWNQWSGLQSNYTIANATTSALADGWYRISTIAWDGQLYSPAWSPDQWFRVDTRRPEVSSVTPAAGASVGSPFAVSARYSEPYGYEGKVLFAVNRLDGSGETYAWSQQVASGQTATANLTISQPGQYDLYAIGNDGAGDPNAYGVAWSGPYRITVANRPTAPTGVTADPGPSSARIRWTPGPNNGAPITSYSVFAYDSASPSPAIAPKTCANPCSPSDGFAFDGLIPQRSYTFKVTATNAIGTSGLSEASPTVVVRGTSDYASNVVATAGDRNVRLEWQAQFLATSYRIRTYLGERPSSGVPNEAHFVNSTEVGAVTTQTFTGLKNGSRYYFTVTPVVLLLLVGQPSPASNQVIPFGVPFAPAGVGGVVKSNEVIVFWSPPGIQEDGTPGDNGAAISSYEVMVFSDPDGSPVQTLSVQPEITLVSIKSLSNGLPYSFKVKGINQAGPGAISESTGSGVPGGRPFPPENPAADAAAGGKATVTWRPPSARSDGTPGNNWAPITNTRSLSPPIAPIVQGPRQTEAASLLR